MFKPGALAEEQSAGLGPEDWEAAASAQEEPVGLDWAVSGLAVQAGLGSGSSPCVASCSIAEPATVRMPGSSRGATVRERESSGVERSTFIGQPSAKG
jgi:hypothetical protein